MGQTSTLSNSSPQHFEATIVRCHDYEIPSFVKIELERLYENVYSSLAFFHVESSRRDVSTYVATKGGKIAALFLFVIRRRKLVVLNEMIKIDDEEMQRFVNYAFGRFASISVISFAPIQTTLSRLPFPHQKVNVKEDYVLNAPGTQTEYFECLSKSMRASIKRYTKRLLQKHSTFESRFYEKEEIKEEHFRAIIDLSKRKMESRKKKIGVNEVGVRSLLELARVYGFVNVILINGRLCAGSINYRVGTSYFGVLSGYDTDYEDCWLGGLCYYFTISESIARGAKKFHMGHGRLEYKTRLLGVMHDLHKVVIYRSPLYVVLNCDTALKTAFQGYVRQAKLWLQDPSRQDSFTSRLARDSMYFLRSLRHDG